MELAEQAVRLDQISGTKLGFVQLGFEFHSMIYDTLFGALFLTIHSVHRS